MKFLLYDNLLGDSQRSVHSCLSVYSVKVEWHYSVTEEDIWGEIILFLV